MLRSVHRYTEQLQQARFEADCPHIEQVLSEQELINRVGNYDGWIIGDDPATSAVFRAGVAGKLKAAIKWGVGTDNVDFDGAQAVGLKVANTPGMFGDEVADLAMSYAVALARRTFEINEGVHRGEWPKPVGYSLRNKTAAVVGYGNIGKEVCARLTASKLNVQIYDPHLDKTELPDNIQELTWPEGIGNADILILCCALTPQSRHMLDRDLLKKCKPGVFIINVSRGALIDEPALAESLADGKVAAAALEVFESEPLPHDSCLREFRHCIFGSHNASNTQEAVDRTSLRAIELLSTALTQ